MKKLLLFVSGLLVLGFLSCEKENENRERWKKEIEKTVLDSIGSSYIIAAFNEDSCFSVLEFHDDKKIARKLVYRKGYPLFIDTLVYKKYDEYSSKRFATSYLIKDTVVLVINFVKIIHPSSNWQGQTPWQQPYIFTCVRTDKKYFGRKK